MFRRAGAPLVAQPVGRHVVLLATARLERRDLCCPSGSLPARRHMREDLGPALREVLDHLARHAGDVRGSVLDGVPADVEAFGQLGAQDRLVEVTGGLGVPVEQLPVQRRPSTVVGAGRVGDDDVGVEQRIAGARCSMAEPGGDEALTLDDGGAASPAPRATRLALHVLDRLADRRFVSGDDLSRHLGLGDAEEDRDALRCPERQVEAGDRALVGHRPTEQLTAGRIASLEQPHDALLAHLARQAERRRAAAVPDAGRLTFAGVVVLATLRDLVDVVAPGARAGGELADVQHPALQAAEEVARAK
jgi:hypothetical protein